MAVRPTAPATVPRARRARLMARVCAARGCAWSDLGQVLEIEVGVNLGGRQVRVAEQPVPRAGRRSTRAGGQRMSAAAYAGAPVLPGPGAASRPSKRFAPRGRPNAGPASKRIMPPHRQAPTRAASSTLVSLRARVPPDRHDARLVALAGDAHGFVGRDQRHHIEADEFRQTQTGGI